MKAIHNPYPNGSGPFVYIDISAQLRLNNLSALRPTALAKKDTVVLITLHTASTYTVIKVAIFEINFHTFKVKLLF